MVMRALVFGLFAFAVIQWQFAHGVQERFLQERRPKEHPGEEHEKQEDGNDAEQSDAANIFNDVFDHGNYLVVSGAAGVTGAALMSVPRRCR